jgi:hypothetical protein
VSFDFLKVAQVIMGVVHVVEKIKGAKSGPEKLQAALDSTPDMIQAVEAGVGKDILNDASVLAAEAAFISAYVSLQNAIRKAKDAKGTGAPV